jgi:hypothetical protein
MSKHTAGPWKIGTVGIGTLEIVPVSDTRGPKQEGLPVATVHNCHNGAIREDANLIAAAPELLEVVELCMHFMKHHRVTEKENMRYEKALAAIAKVKGEQS